MKFKIRYADQIVGFFSILALAGLIALIFALGSRQHWFEKKYYYYTVFDSGSGVSVGMDLTYKGFSIGKVSKLGLKDNFVRVDYYILGEYSEYIKENSLVQLVTSPIGLGSTFSFYPGVGPDLIPSGSEIYRVDSGFGEKIIADKKNRIEKQNDSIGALMSQVSELLTHVNSLVSQVDDALSGRVRGNKTTPIQNIVAQLSGITESIHQILASDKGPVTELLGPEMTTSLVEALDNLAVITQSFTGVASNADKLVANAVPQIDSALVQLNTVLVQVQDVLTGLKNNPLIRGGVPDRSKTDSATVQLRSEDF